MMRVCEVKYRIEYFNKPQQNIYLFRISSAKKILYNNKKIKENVIYLNLRKEKKILDFHTIL